ncbi:class I SAM-dependent methyltransferase [Streptomyces himalayensis]|uniref:class I SAM-dependent methyltransferase n=1 Tax=Streptomyces himalayensis TaxID=2820085 RepID=UPI0028A75ED0|nr:methyltransferase domain-containing protein [Streptomyces himalayensis]
MTVFDENERLIWAGRAHAYADTFARLCAHPVPVLLDAAAVGDGVRVLDVGTGPGAAAAAACARGAKVTAVDAEPSMVRLAAQSVPKADVRLAALPDLPFADGEFDAVVANFVLNHVGRPRAAVAELRRITRASGRVALTIWAAPPAAGQTLIGRAMEAAGVTRPDHLPALDPLEDFPRTPDGLAELLRAADLREVHCELLTWNHTATAEDWWAGPASGVACIGHLLTSQPPYVIAEAKRHYDLLSGEFAGSDGMLSLPHAALLAHGRMAS